MNKNITKLLITALAAIKFTSVLGAALDAGDAETFVLKNNRGSVLQLTKHFSNDHINAGTITGTFTTAVARKHCKDVIGVPMPITGFFNGDAVSYSINYPTCKSVIATTGNFDTKNNLHVLWIVTSQAENSETTDWNSRLVGHDDYLVQ